MIRFIALGLLSQSRSNAGSISLPRCARQLRTAVYNIHSYLREGGCVVISRNRDVAGGEVEDRSAWRKTGPRFTHLEDFGSGSEIKEIVDGCGGS